MFCPECGGEYREGFTHCADCDVDLVADPPVDDTEPLSEVLLVTVFETGDPGELMFAESVLRGAGIPYVKQGESLQDLFAMGRLGTGFNLVAGPILIQVPEEQAEAAAGLLAEALPDQPGEEEWEQEAEPE
jgi:Putative prokaryotic signal transducing protein